MITLQLPEVERNLLVVPRIKINVEGGVFCQALNFLYLIL